MDDIGAVTEHRGYVFIQAKHHLTLSPAAHSPLADALDQAVRQYINGAPRDPPGACRPLDPHRDALVICTDSAASAPIRMALATVVMRLANHPKEMPLADAARNAEEQRALHALLDHLQVAFARYSSGPPSMEQIRMVLSLLRVVSLDLNSDGSARVAAEIHLRELLADAAMASGAWNDLVTLGQKLMEGQQWADLDEVRNALASAGHPTGVDPAFRRDAQRLRDITAANLAPNALELTIPAPEGPISIHREVTELLGSTDGSFALIGEPGAGKSVLTAEVAAQLRYAGEDVVFLAAENLAGSLGATRTELNMQDNLDSVLRGWHGSGRATLIVDGVDGARGTGSVDWLPHLARRLQGTRWRVLASIRSFDLRHGPSWRGMFPGEPIDLGHAEHDFAHVRHVLIGNLTDNELTQARNQSPRLDALVRAADYRLLELLRNPFNLRLAAELLRDGDGTAVAAVQTRQGLLHLYWDRRVAFSLHRHRAVRELSQAMLRSHRTRVADPSAAVNPALLHAVEDLLHDGVLREAMQARRVDARPVVFSHPVLYDFAVAVACLGGEDPLQLAHRLDSDPNLAITVHPSLDMHLADLWADDPTRASFWNLATVLSRPHGGHPIAAVAAALAALRQRPTHSDLVPLLGRAIASDDSGRAARMGVAYLAEALGTGDLSTQDRLAAVPVLAEFAARLAAQSIASVDFGLADLAKILLRRLDACDPLNVNSAGTEARVRAVSDVMRCALADPSAPGREDLAMQIGETMSLACAISPDVVAPVIEEVLAPPVMATWGGRVVGRLIPHLSGFAASAPELAERLALSAWTFEELRDERTSITNSNILSLTSDRRQDLEMARWATGEAFPKVLAAAPDAALRIFLSALDTQTPATEVSRVAGRPPRVYQGNDLEHAAGYGALNTMAQSVVAFFVSSAASHEPAILARTGGLIRLVGQRLTHHQVWNILLQAGASNSQSLGRHLLPLLAGSDLLGHYLTRTSAARVVAALSPILSTSEHLELEAAVIQARDPLDTNGNQSQDLVDALLGQLDRNHIQGDAARVRLCDLDNQGGPPPVAEWSPPQGAFRPYGMRERVRGTGPFHERVEALLQAVERLRADLTGPESNDQAPRTSVPALYTLLTQPNLTIDQATFDEAFSLLLMGAEHLAKDPEVLPGTDLGEIILALFAAAAPAAPSAGVGS